MIRLDPKERSKPRNFSGDSGLANRDWLRRRTSGPPSIPTAIAYPLDAATYPRLSTPSPSRPTPIAELLRACTNDFMASARGTLYFFSKYSAKLTYIVMANMVMARVARA